MATVPSLYPLRFAPQYLHKIWGGTRLADVLQRPLEVGQWGESWELSGLSERPSRVANGPLRGVALPDLMARYGRDLVGEAAEGQDFPVLIKLLDAQRDLSIQVHPNDALAARKHGGSGKTEMWYILAAEPGARLITGFKEGVALADYEAAMAEGRLLEVCNEVPVAAGEVYRVPAGRIHTIGAGILLAEIQQSSDYTYRIYDWDRRDAEGNRRELHQEEAREALNFAETGSGQCPVVFDAEGRAPLVQGPPFTTLLRRSQQPTALRHANPRSFTVYTVVEGSGTLHYQGLDIPLAVGEVILLPAGLSEWEVRPQGKILFLETHL